MNAKERAGWQYWNDHRGERWVLPGDRLSVIVVRADAGLQVQFFDEDGSKSANMTPEQAEAFAGVLLEMAAKAGAGG